MQAPLAGGASTVALAAAVCDAGGLGFLAAGMKTPDKLLQQVRDLRGATTASFGVNVFVPARAPGDPGQVQRYVDQLRAAGAEPGEPRFEDDGWEAKLALLEEQHPAVVSFTFGCPPAGVVTALQGAGSEVWVTVTSPAEACEAGATGADALIAQGVEAGGHRGGFDDQSGGELGLLALLALLGGPESGLPLVASGGIATAPTVAAVLAAGARAAQVGTAFMRCPEAGTHPMHREALAKPAPTALTRAFTGRRARGIANRFMAEHEDAPAAYPELLHVMGPLRAAAARSGDREGLNLWAGQAHELARAAPAAEVVAMLAERGAY
ncbi:MAG: nitronate monooxygenase [Thermoleophilaceae bacterium]